MSPTCIYQYLVIPPSLNHISVQTQYSQILTYLYHSTQICIFIAQHDNVPVLYINVTNSHNDKT